MKKLPAKLLVGHPHSGGSLLLLKNLVLRRHGLLGRVCDLGLILRNLLVCHRLLLLKLLKLLLRGLVLCSKSLELLTQIGSLLHLCLLFSRLLRS